MAGKTFVVEHMEPDSQTSAIIPKWVQLEYTHICLQTLHQPLNKVVFSNLTQEAQSFLSTTLPREQCECLTLGIEHLVNSGQIQKERICLLDPRATKSLSPEDDALFDVFLFGGILGDDPPRDRTAELRKLGYGSRHLGPVQMTTDTAVTVTQRVVQGQVPLQDLPFTDHPTIRFNKHESVEMPFRYIEEDGDPLMPPGMKQLLHDDMDRSFEF